MGVKKQYSLLGDAFSRNRDTNTIVWIDLESALVIFE